MITEQLVKRIAKIVFKKTGITCNSSSLVKAIKEGIKNTHSPNAMYFLKLLEKEDKYSTKILEDLINHLTPKTAVFFEPHYQFELLSEEVLPSLIEKYTTFKKSIKIWNFECKTGEVIYSLAIILNEFLPLDTANIELLATDSNDFNLAQAIKGVYQYWALRKFEFEILSKYFNPTMNGYQIKEDIKSSITFKKLDIINDKYPTNVDLIICNHTLNYINPDNLNKVYENIYKSLNLDGYLLLHNPNIPQELSNMLNTIVTPKGIIYKKTKPQIKLQKSIEQTKIEPVVMTTTPKEEVIVTPEQLKTKSLNKPYKTLDKNLLTLENQLKDNPYNKNLILEYVTQLWTEGDLNKAKEWCERLLVLDPLNVQGQYLLASIYEELGDLGLALRSYEKLINIKPDALIAYFSIGCIANKLNQPKKALKYFMHTQSMLNSLDPSSKLEFATHLTVKELSSMVNKEIEKLSKI